MSNHNKDIIYHNRSLVIGQNSDGCQAYFILVFISVKVLCGFTLARLTGREDFDSLAKPLKKSNK